MPRNYEAGDNSTRKIHIRDIFLLVLLATFWGSAFLFIKIAVDQIPPMTLAAGRVGLGALVILSVVLARGQSLPRDMRSWAAAATVAMTGTVTPFFLIGWGQQSVDAALTAIAMASVPLYTLPLAHLMTHDERLSGLKVAGIAVGFGGVILLVSESMGGGMGASLGGLIAILAAAFGYAVSGLLIRRIPGAAPGTTGAMILIAGTLILIPLSLVTDRPWTLAPDRTAIMSVFILGFFATGLATLVLIHLINTVGATFTSLNNYLVPVVGIACGVIWLDERLTFSALLAFGIILAGIFLTTRAANRIDPRH